MVRIVIWIHLAKLTLVFARLCRVRLREEVWSAFKESGGLLLFGVPKEFPRCTNKMAALVGIFSSQFRQIEARRFYDKMQPILMQPPFLGAFCPNTDCCTKFYIVSAVSRRKLRQKNERHVLRALCELRKRY